MRKIFIAVLICSLLAPFLVQPSLAQVPPPKFDFQRSWGGEGNVIDHPSDLALTSDGVLYIANQGYNRIFRLDTQTDTYTTIGGMGYADGYFQNLGGLGVDTAGNLYVASFCKVQKFHPDGTYMTTLPDSSCYPGSGVERPDNQFPLGLAVSPEGNVYVVTQDTTVGASGNVLRKYDPAGTLVKTWRTTFAEQPAAAGDVAVSADGKVFLADREDQMVRVFDQQLTPITSFPATNPMHIAFTQSGEILVADWENSKIYRFDENYALVGTWGDYGTGPGQIQHPKAIIVDNLGQLWVAETGTNRVQTFDSSGTFIRQWGIPCETDGQFDFPSDVLHHPDTGLVYVADAGNYRIQVFTKEGAFLHAWGSFDDPLLSFNRPYKLAIDPDGLLYVLDPTQKMVKILDPVSGKLLNEWSFDITIVGGHIGTEDLVISAGEVYPLTTIYVDNVVTKTLAQVFTLAGSHLRDIEFPGVKNYPTVMALDSEGILFVAVSNPYEIMKFTPTGTLILSWQSSNGGQGVDSLEFGADGMLYAFNGMEINLKRFNPSSGSLNGLWVGDPLDPSLSINGPWSGMWLDPSGEVYITDTLCKRVFVIRLPELAPAQAPLLNSAPLRTADRAAASPLLPNGDFEAPDLSPWAYGGSLSVQKTLVINRSTALSLGDLANTSTTGQDSAWAAVTLKIPSALAFPKLSFEYQLTTEAALKDAEFIVEVLDGVSLNHLATVLSDGLNSSSSSGPVTKSWRTASFDLRPFIGQTVRIQFQSRQRNLGSSGMLVLLDNVKLFEAGAKVFLPLTLK